MNRRLRQLQLVTAVVLLPLVLFHVGFIFYVALAELSAGEILKTIRGRGWMIYYGVFVAAVAVHGPIGLRNILLSWTRWRGITLECSIIALTLLLLVTGGRALVQIMALDYYAERLFG